MTFKERLEAGTFTVVAELLPPKGIDLQPLFGQADRLKSCVDALSVPDLPNAIMRIGSLPVCVLLQQKGFEVIYHLSSGHRNRLALQSELLNAAAFGLKNLMVLPGDHPSIGDHYEAPPVFDLDVFGLLQATQRLQEGFDLMGNDLQGKPLFYVGSQVHIGVQGQALDQELLDMEKMVKLGARFFFTTPLYDPHVLEHFMKKAGHLRIPILVGVPLLKSAGMARYMSKHVAGASIPESIIERLMKAPDKQQASLEIAAEVIRNLKSLCQGVVIHPIGWEHLVPSLVEQAGL